MLVATLIEHDLVDELRVMIDPVVLGGGYASFVTTGAQVAQARGQPGDDVGRDPRDLRELQTRDYEQTVDFYRDVFTWDTHAMSDTPELRYTTLGEGENMLAGIMDAKQFLPNGAPASWSVYFGVEDADVALAQIAELGGKVVRPAEDTPYGRLAVATDPTGTRFKLVAD